MATTISGQRTSVNIESARRVIDMLPTILLLEDDRKSLFTFAASMGVRKVTNPTFKWLVDEKLPKADAINFGAGYVSTATSVVVDNGGYFVPNDIIKVPRTGETMLVTAVSTNTLTVTRSWGGTAGAALVDNDPVYRIGNTWSEFSSLRDSSQNIISSTTQSTEHANYCQYQRFAFGLSQREKDSELYGENDRRLQQMKKLLEASESINMGFWHGEEALSGSQSSTGGVLENIAAGDSEAIPTLTEDEFEDFLRSGSRYGNQSRKPFFCSRFVKQVISGFARPNQRITDPGGSTKYGVNVTEYHSGTGFTAELISDHSLEGAVWDGYGALIDAQDVKMACMPNGELKLLEDQQLPDVRGVVDSYEADCGLQYGHPSKHRKLTGVTG